MSKEIQIVPKPSLSLYAMAEEWQELMEFLATDARSFDFDEARAERAETEFLAMLQQKFLDLRDKRDSFADFLDFIDERIAAMDAKRKAIAETQSRLEKKRDWLRGEVAKIIQAFGKTDKGSWRRLEGHTSTLQLNKNPASVEITDAEAVPLEFKEAHIAIDLPWIRAKAVLDALMQIQGFETTMFSALGLRAGVLAPWTIDKKAIAEVLKSTKPCGRCGQLGVIDSGIKCECSHPAMCTCAGRIIVCPDCHGEKILHGVVPGARLVTENVRLVRK